MRGNYSLAIGALLANIILFLGGMGGSLELLIILLLVLLVEAAAGLIMVFYASTRKKGMALLIVSIVSLIIGLSVCSNLNNPI